MSLDAEINRLAEIIWDDNSSEDEREAACDALDLLLVVKEMGAEL